MVAQAPFGRLPLRIQAARVGGVEIPNAKRIEFSLRYVYGIGPTTAKAILADTVGILRLESLRCQVLPSAITSPEMNTCSLSLSTAAKAVETSAPCMR